MRNLSDIPKYVIEAPEKRESLIGNQLRELGQGYISIPGNFLSEFPSYFVPKRSWIKCRRHLSLPEIGCSLSHLECYRKFLRSNAQIALIFEDDAKIVDLDLFEKCLQQILELDFSERICVSFYTSFATLKKGLTLNDLFHYVVDAPSTTLCYAITRSAALALLEANNNLDFNADWPKNTKIKFYLAKSMVVIPGNSNSFIAMDRGTTKITKVQRFSIMFSIFTGIHLVLYRKSFKNVKEYFFTMIWPTCLRTFYRLLSIPSKNFNKKIRISIWR